MFSFYLSGQDKISDAKIDENSEILFPRIKDYIVYNYRLLTLNLYPCTIFGGGLSVS